MIKFIFIFLISSISFAAEPQAQLNCPEGSKINKRTTKTGSIEECLSTASGEPEGPRFEYNSKKSLRRIWHFKNGVPDGEFKVFDDKKQLKREGTFVNGRLSGKMTRWHSKGVIQDETHWLDGRPHGEVKRFAKNGKTVEAGNYQTGRRVGLWKFAKGDGAPLPERNYGEGIGEKAELQDWTATVSVISGELSQLIVSPTADVEKKSIDNNIVYNARVDVDAKSSGWTLQYQSKAFEPLEQEGRKFTIDIPINSKDNTVELLANGPAGQKVQFKVLVLAPDYPAAPQVANASDSEVFKEVKKSKFVVAAGLNQRKYQEGSLVNVESSGLQLKLQFNRQVYTPKIEVQTSVIYEGVSLARSAGYSAVSFLDFNGALGYHLPEFSEKWKLALFGGLYYRTTSSGDGTYGYKNLSGPELFPLIKYQLSKNQSLFASYHYSPLITSDMGLEPSAEIETSMEFGWVYMTNRGAELSVSFYSTQLKMESTNASLDNKSNGVLLGYGF